MAYEQESPLINGASNNTTATQDALGAGWMTASLSSSSDVDYFKLTTTSAALIKLELSNALLTATKYWNLALLDGNGDYVTSLTSTVSGSPTVDGSSNTGTTLAVTGLTSAVPVGSRFTFATSSADTTIYTVTSATALNSGSSTLTLDTSLPGGLAASTALVFDPAQTQAAGGLTTLTGQVAAAGTYFVKVSPASWSDANYSVRASVLPTVESSGDNSSKTAAIPSSTTDQNRPVENAWMTGHLSDATDVDYWVFSTATMSGDINVDFAAATGDNNTPEWNVKLTRWTGDQELTTVQGAAISSTAGASKTFTIDAAKYSSADTFVIEVLKADGVAVDTGAYTLRVRGSTLDMNDTPVITIDSVTSARPYDVIDTAVTRSVKAASKVALSTLFSASDADVGQTIASYKVALSKATGEVAAMAGSIALIEADGTTSATYAMNTSITLTAAQMAKAYLLPGAVTGSLSLALQAFDSSGALDNSGASSVMLQTLRVVSSNVGITFPTPTGYGLSAGSPMVEGSGTSSETLTFSLATQPTGDVKVYVEQDSNNRFTFNSSVLTFTSVNYATSQTVSVTARDNKVTEGAHTGQITFRVVSADSQYDGYSITPLTVAIADPADNLPTGSVTIAGTPTQGQTLTATNSLADTDGLGTISYQWSAAGTAITGATNSTLVLAEAQVGKTITATASYTDLLGHAESVTSGATNAVVNVNDAPTGSVTITGTPTQGQTLTAANSLADADGLGAISYQWSAGGTAITGATSSTLVLADAQVGKTITVSASYTDGHGTAESVSSNATVAVAVAPTPAPSPSPTPTPNPITVDGATGSITTSTSNGQTTITETIDPVSSGRIDTGNGTSSTLADIPLATDSTGAALVQVGLPVGVGVTSVTTEAVSGGTPQTLRQQLITASTGHIGNADQLAQVISDGIDLFAATVTDSSQVTVRAITLTVAAGTTAAPNAAIHISGATGGGEGDASHPLRQEALLIDTSHLPSGTVLNLDDVEFAVIAGPAIVTGGLGRNYVIGDGSAQTIVLGPDDDILHGGAGNDVVGSKGGNDQLFGDEGSDTVVGGLGDDHLEGGAGDDLLVGGQSDAGAFTFTQLKNQLTVSWSPNSTDLADSSGFSFPGNYSGGTPIDPRLAFGYQTAEMRETIAELYQAYLHRLPSVQEMNYWCTSGWTAADLDQGVANLIVNPLTGQSVQQKVTAVLSQIWGANKVTPELVHIGVDHINAGGTWGRVVQVLIGADTFKAGMLNTDGSMTLTQQWSLTDSGWSSDTGADTLLGGAGNDTLVGGHGNDVLDGGDGTDTAVWFGQAANFEVQIVGTGANKDVALVDKSSGEVDIIRNLEQLQIGGVNLDATKLETLANVEAYLASHTDHHLEVVLVGLAG